MGDPRGFLKHERRDRDALAVEDRLKHHDEHYIDPPDEMVQNQASRCMDCGVPYCMSGCPLGNLIPEWNDLVYHGRWRDAYERLSQMEKAPEQRDPTIGLEALMREFHEDAGARIDAEDRVAGLFGMEPADLLVHCPHYQMSMKVAEILVFWNGALRPLADCTDDALVGAKLASILESHRNLWAIRAFANPAFADRADELADACDFLFCQEPSRRRRLERQFYGGVVDRLCRPRGLPADEHDRAVRRGLDRILRLPERGRTIEAARAAAEASTGG